jgi:flagellar protein FlaJ
MSFFGKMQVMLNAAGTEEKAQTYFIKYLIIGIFLAVVGAFVIYSYVSDAAAVGGGIAIFLGFEGVVYGGLIRKARKRVNEMEDMLPDFLTLMASNIRSGLTPDRALLLSTRREFGPLTEEIDKAAKATLTGTPFTEAFMEMSHRFNSEMLSKTVRLIVEGSRSGGSLADLLDNTALDIQRFASIRKEVSATVLVYMLFMFAAAAIGAPLLYAVSTMLIEVITEMKSEITVSTEDVSAYMPLIQGSTVISPELVFWFALFAIFIGAFFGSLAAGVISKGRESAGLGYIPTMIIISFAVFFLSKLLLESLLGGLFMM